MAMGHRLELKAFKEAEINLSLAPSVGLISDGAVNYSMLLMQGLEPILDILMQNSFGVQ
jgi:hypothetical protein